MIHSVQITIVNLDRNAVDLAQGWYVDALDPAGALAEVLRLLAGTETMPDNPFETSEIGAGGLILPEGYVRAGDEADRSTTGN